MMSMHSSTHSSQMNTVGPAISLRTSCWLLPQNEQYRVFFESLPPDLLIFSLRLSPLLIAPPRSPHHESGVRTQWNMLVTAITSPKPPGLPGGRARSRRRGHWFAFLDDRVDMAPFLGLLGGHVTVAL